MRDTLCEHPHSMNGSMSLAAGDVEVVFDLAHGGRMASFKLAGVERLVTKRNGDMMWGCYPMVPWAGRVEDGQFRWQNAHYQLPKLSPPHAIHGTVFNRPWTRIDPFKMTCELDSPWPWRGRVMSIIELTECQMCWTLDVQSKDAEMPVVMGWHPWFRRAPKKGIQADYQFDAKQIYERDDRGIPTGRRLVPGDGPFDDCFTHLTQNPSVTWSDGYRLELKSSCQHWVIYDEPTDAFCIEPQSAPPNAFNAFDFDVAAPRSPAVHTMTWSWTHINRSSPLKTS